MTTDQINLLSRGLKFVPTPTTNETALRIQLLKDFKDFARRMRLQFIYHGEDNNIHPFYVKSNWEPPVQRSVARCFLFLFISDGVVPTRWVCHFIY